MKVIRTQEEIVNRINNVEMDIFGNLRGDLYPYLEFERLRQFYKKDLEECKKEELKKWHKQHNNPLKEIKDYMSFAWDKANNCRGISASRSLEHFETWIWLIDDDFYKKFKESVDTDYCYYGKPQLEMICEHFNIDYSELDDGMRSNEEY